MAQLARALASPQQGGQAPDPQTLELAHLLSRLQQSALHPSPERERRLRTSEYERTRLESNLEYARSLLTKLEQDALAMKAPARRGEAQANLNLKREQLDLLFDRLKDLRNMATDEDEDSSEDEDLLGDVVPTPSESTNSVSADAYTEEEADDEEEEVASIPRVPASQASQQPQALPTASPPPVDTVTQPQSTTQTHTTNTLRSRKTPNVSDAPSSSLSPTLSFATHASARAALFANRRKPLTAETSTATAEAILDNQRHEQDALSDSILKMAGTLKASSQKFSSTLEADKEVVSRAGDGMDRTERGMDATRGRMGTLRKMTEGTGWWGRIILYVWVYGLMVALVLLVFVMPKLRF